MKAAWLGLAALVLGAGVAVAAELKSGLQPGEDLGAFEVEKCAGAVNDGRKAGDTFCYRCMLGNRPVVMVFARKADDKLAKLVKELDKEVAEHADEKLGSFVNLIGKDASALKKTAKEFAEKNKVDHVALVVPQDHENGPTSYNVSPDAEVTVIIYNKGKVAANHAFASGKLDAKAIAAIVADTDKMLN